MESQRAGPGPGEIDEELAVLQGSWQMSKCQRLHRWAELLDLEEEQTLRLVGGAQGERADNSPLTVAFEDWALRAEGLQGDRVADAVEFFDLAEDEVQGIVGASHCGRATILAPAAARRVRRLAVQAEPRPVPRAGVLATGASAAALLALVLIGS